jgi:hypothetical protein
MTIAQGYKTGLKYFPPDRFTDAKRLPARAGCCPDVFQLYE